MLAAESKGRDLDRDGIATKVTEQYLEERVARRELSPMTARNQRSTLVGFVAAVGDDLAAISVDDVGQWLAGIRKLSASTRRAHFSTVKTFLSWAVKEGVISTNPAAALRAPKQPRSVPRALTPINVARLLAVCIDRRAKAICSLMVGMGLRCAEVAYLEAGDWDQERGLMRIVGKGSHERVLPVPPEVAEALECYLEEWPASAGPLIRSYRQWGEGLTPDTISGMVSEWMRAAGIKRRARDGVAAHALRHTAASDVLDRCGDLRVVQQMLGHSQLATTSIYLRRAGLSQLREAMEGRRYDGGAA